MDGQPTIQRRAAAWRRASEPESLFGPLAAPQEENLRRRYRALASEVHPDRHRGSPDECAAAVEAFQLLQGWYEQAQRRVAAGRYGASARFTLASGRAVYEVDGDALRGELADLHPAQRIGGGRALLKIVRRPHNNDLMEREATALATLERALVGNPLRAHFPTLIESFVLRDDAGAQRRVNVLAHEQGVHTLAEVMAAHPRGLHPADAAWMFNRLLAALAVAHDAGLVHGAVLPEHLMIRPSDHNGMLIDWCYSVPLGGTIRAISAARRDDYAPEVLARAPATPATDLFMAARCLARLLGSADGSVSAVPGSVPPPFVAFLRGCLIAAPARRPTDAWVLLDDFRALLERLYGPPTFRPFELVGARGSS